MKNLLIAAAISAVLVGIVSCAGGPAVTGEEPVAEVKAPTAGEAEDRIVVEWKPSEETVLFVDGTVDKRVEYEYDAEGRILKVVETDAREELLSMQTYAYDDGRPVSRELSDAAGVVAMTLYETDDRGNIIGEIGQDAAGEPLSGMSFEYGNSGLVVKSVAFDGAGMPRLTAEYAYDGTTVISVAYILPGGVEEARFERTLENGLAVEEKTVLPDGTVETSRTFRYSDGRLAEVIHFASGMKMKSVRYEYDSEGNVIRETWSNSGGRDYEIIERSWLRFETAE